MKQLFLSSLLLLCGGGVFAQASADYTVQITATVQETPAKITLKWKPMTIETPTYSIWKKAKSATGWGTAIASLTAADSSYVDNAVVVDSAYEYQIRAYGSTITATGYIFAGIKSPALHYKGTLLLLVDSTFSDSCATEIARLAKDISGDGWQVVRHDFARTAADTTIKAVIAADVATHPNVKSVLLLGHLAVPYSGNQNPDGHTDHLGAWPADMYYSCMSGWTDVSVNETSSSYPANRNTPGDSKWDQIALPSVAQLQVGRIDFNNMPAFAATEVTMMKRYLNKDHNYKMDMLAVRRRALINDNFGGFSGEAFAANGWRNFVPMVSRDSVYFGIPFISSLAGGSYQWAYGCGGGSFTSASGIGNTSDFASASGLDNIFTVLFGSYFGDWNVQNSFLRAPLCATVPALTSCWAGRPNWFFHHMSMGENIGYAALLSQSNAAGGIYQPTGFGGGWVHTGLMGDPTLRTQYIKQPAGITIAKVYRAGATISWTASPDTAVKAYYVYRADSAFGFYKRISPMVTGTSFRDTVGADGKKHYMVRPLKLQTTPSGNYYNLGIGITDTASVTYHPVSVGSTLAATIGINLYPNPAQSVLNVAVVTADAAVVTMYVVNMAGQQFHTVTKMLQAGENNFALNVADLAPGMYTLVCKYGTETIAKNWVKQ